MSKTLFSIIIIVLLIKSGNVFSKENIFNVDNIIVTEGKNKNKQQILNSAFNAGFEKLIKKILLKKDAKLILKTNSDEIKNLISSYKIKKIENSIKNEVVVNISFNREKINKFFYKKNISYADINLTKVVVLPVFIKNNKNYFFSDNFFYNNWNKDLQEDEFIEYILPLENLDDIKFLNQNSQNLENINIQKILLDYDVEDYIFLIISRNEDIFDLFIKGKIANKEVIKNIKIKSLKSNENLEFKKLIKKIKIEINEIWKKENLIDVRTPSFLNILLKINESNDLLKLKKILDQIDLIENYSVTELNKSYARIRIKYLGKINKLQKKFIKLNLISFIDNNNWTIKLK